MARSVRRVSRKRNSVRRLSKRSVGGARRRSGRRSSRGRRSSEKRSSRGRFFKRRALQENSSEEDVHL